MIDEWMPRVDESKRDKPENNRLKGVEGPKVLTREVIQEGAHVYRRMCLEDLKG